MEKSYQEIILLHYEEIWKNAANIYLWDKGPIDKLPFDFRILEFPPNEHRKMWTYATCCMSQPGDSNPIELHVFSLIKDNGLVELLTIVAYYHRNTANLNLHHTINFGKSWQGSSICTHGFISLPYLDGPALENLEFSNRQVKLFWLIPVSLKEVEYKNKHGADALEAKFEESEFDYVNYSRKSII